VDMSADRSRSRDELLDMGFDAATVQGAEPTPTAWSRIVEGPRPRRHPDWPQVEPSGTSPLDALASTAAELGDLLDSLPAADWATPALDGAMTLREIAEHLVGVERYLLGQLGRRPALQAEHRRDHWPVARTAAADLSGAPGEMLARQWWREVTEFMAVCSEASPESPVQALDLPGTVRALVVLRLFELWTHGDDVRRALGAPLNLLDDTRLSLMSGELMEALPIGTALTGQAHPGRTARFCLTGSGGGTFDVPLAWGDAPGPPDLIVTVDTIELCRLASHRVAPESLAARVDGDRSLLASALAAAAAFAAD
jgi:uncharacterized protein (TIGR03083 family)